MTLTTFSVNDSIHLHLTSAISAGATPGMYLVCASLTSSDPGISASAPFYLVYGYSADEADHEAAVTWTQTNYVPEPAGVMAMLSVSSMLALRRLKR